MCTVMYGAGTRLRLQGNSCTGRHPSPHPFLSTKPSGDLAGGEAAVFHPLLCLQTSKTWPWHQETQLHIQSASTPHPALRCHHPALATFPTGSVRWKPSFSSGSTRLKDCEGRGCRSSFLPSPPRTRLHHVDSKRRKEERIWDSRHSLGLSNAIWILAETFCLFSLSDTLVVFCLPCLSL